MDPRSRQDSSQPLGLHVRMAVITLPNNAPTANPVTSDMSTASHPTGWKPLTNLFSVTQSTGVDRRSSHPNPLRSNPPEQGPQRSSSVNNCHPRNEGRSGQYNMSEYLHWHLSANSQGRGKLSEPDVSNHWSHKAHRPT